ncbi:MAG: adenylate/guanylate cyclase domain-containing protein [Gammaproteobacteria bacterium]|jgi:TolB-like protein/class 3 adenylate cyclase
MALQTIQRRLAAILSADAVGYTRLMATDELSTLETLNCFRSLISGLVRQHGGRVVDMVGDNLLAEFPSAVDAVQCALETQRQLAVQNGTLEPGRQMRFRIGINVGDLIVDGDRIVGDGVNVAARIEATAEPGGVAIAQSVLDQVEGKLPIQVADTGDHELKNVSRPVRIFRLLDGDAQHAPAADEAVQDPASMDPHVPGFAGRHSIAVLPFRNLSQDIEQEYFADGLAEDLVASLGALRMYPIISRNSSFSYKGKNVDVRQVGKELGAHYIVTGSVRRSGDRLRVTAELVDAAGGHQIWSGRYDRQLSDIFEIQDEITAEIAASVGPALSQSEMRHAIRRSPQDLDAWTSLHRGMWHLFHRSKEAMVKAREWGKAALDLQPDSATAWSLLCFSHMYDVIYQWTDTPEKSLQMARSAADKAMALDNEDPMALTAVGFAASFLKEHDRAISVLERAIELNPSSAFAYWALGAALGPAGRPEEAIPMVEKAIRLSPQDPLMHEFLFSIASAHFAADRYAEAIRFARRSLDIQAEQPGAFRILAAANGYLGRTVDARAALDQMLKLAPDLSEDHLRNFMPDDIVDRYVEGLRKAGWKSGKALAGR